MSTTRGGHPEPPCHGQACGTGQRGDLAMGAAALSLLVAGRTGTRYLHSPNLNSFANIITCSSIPASVLPSETHRFPQFKDITNKRCWQLSPDKTRVGNDLNNDPVRTSPCGDCFYSGTEMTWDATASKVKGAGAAARVRGPAAAVTDHVTSCESFDLPLLGVLIAKVGTVGLVLVWDKVTTSKLLRETSYNKNHSIDVNRNY